MVHKFFSIPNEREKKLRERKRLLGIQHSFINHINRKVQNINQIDDIYQPKEVIDVMMVLWIID